MKMKLSALIACLMLASLACGAGAQTTPQPLDTNGLSTIVAATIQALTPTSGQEQPTETVPPTPQPQPSGVSFNFENISLVIPNGLASDAVGEKMPAITEETGAPWEVGPAYTQITLNSYPLQGTMWNAVIKVYPAEEYRGIDSGVGEAMDKVISIAANPGNPLPSYLPFLPFINAGSTFSAHVGVQNFNAGSGVRYLTQFDQAPLPVNNQEMIYTFQGLSQDGRYYVSVTLPINAAFLPADNSPNSPTPADGIPMDWNNFENFSAYQTAIETKINDTDPNLFSPSIPMLDALIQSITIQ